MHERPSWLWPSCGVVSLHWTRPSGFLVGCGHWGGTGVTVVTLRSTARWRRLRVVLLYLSKHPSVFGYPGPLSTNTSGEGGG